jgi:hypothetical protein
MKVYKTQEQVEADIIDGVLKIDGDVTFKCDIHINADINAMNIDAWNIKAGNIDAWNIDAGDIKAWNIKAGDIKAGDIKALDISYYAVCIAYRAIECTSISGRRNNHRHFCLDSDIVIKEQAPEIELLINGKSAKLSEDSIKSIRNIIN